MIEHWMKPMLCPTGSAVPPDGLGKYDTDRWVFEGKLDGHRALLYRDPDGNVHQLNGRNGSDYSGHLPYLDAEIERILPPGTAVDGELLSTLGRGHVQSVMFSNEPHTPSEISPPLTLVIFDIIRVNGQDIRAWPWQSRRQLVDSVGIGEHTAMSVVFDVDATTALQIAVENGLEGIVLKDRQSRYFNGRSPSWLKCKPQVTAEGRIIGFKPGKAGGQWDGKVGAFEVECLETGATTTIKCGTDARHIEATEHPELWLGAIIEFSHFGYGSTGVPLSPQFKARRLDLEPSGQIEDVERTFDQALSQIEG